MSDKKKTLPVAWSEKQQKNTESVCNWLYGSDTMMSNSDGNKYLVALCLFDPLKPNKFLNNLVPDSRSFPRESWLLDKMRHENRYLWNGSTYILRSIDDSNECNPKINCSVGKYFDMITTCAMLAQELNELVSDESAEQIFHSLKYRKKIHSNQNRQERLRTLWSGRGRSATLAISCLFVINTGQKYSFFAARRAENLADEPGLFHVIPSLVFQPVPNKNGSDPANDFDIEASIFREISEELFNRSERDTRQHQEIDDLQQLIKEERAEIMVTGLAMDLKSLRPEILSLCIIYDPSWFESNKEHMKLSEKEYVTDDIKKAMFDLDDTEIFKGRFAPENCISVGAACLQAGIPIARKRIKDLNY